jgi:hypothetical protein
MYPHERSLVKRLEKQPFALLGVNSDNNKDKLKEVLKKEQITWRSFWNGGSTTGPISKQYRVQGWPTLYIIDAQGVIRHRYLGSPGDQVMDEAIDELIKEAQHKSGAG